MPLAFLLDENLPARLWHAILRHNSLAQLPLDVVRVGQPSDLPLSSDDATILKWAQRERRILVTEDKHTLPRHLDEHLRSGGHSSGVFLIRPGMAVPELVEHLALVAYASSATEWQDRIEYIPS
jgi:predicted nuclease of predicted toxin-antitoxin system